MINDILKFQHRVDQRSNALAQDMIKTLNASRETIIGKLASIQDRYLKGDYTTEAYKAKKAFLEHQRAEIEKVIGEVFEDVKAHIQDASMDVFMATQDHTTKLMNKATGLDVTFFHLDDKVVTAWFETGLVEGTTLTEWLSNLESNTVNRILQAQRSALIEGDSLSGMIKKLREEGIQGSYNGLKGLARTSMLSAANYAREQTIAQAFRDVIDGWQFLSTLDNRTCMECGSLDGKVFGVNEPKPPAPLHWNCRCCYVPVLKSIEGMPEPSEKRPAVTDEETGTFMGSYNQWLKSQLETDPGFVRDVLGPGRFDLFKAGKISLSSMVTNGKIVKLSDLG